MARPPLDPRTLRGAETTGTHMQSGRNRATRWTTIVCCVVASFALAVVSGAADLEVGKELYEQCAQCHGADGGGRSFYLAPSIAGMDEWYVTSQLENFKAGTRGLHADDKGGLRMFPMARSLTSDYGGTDAEKIEAVSAYIASLPEVFPAPEVTGGDAVKGAALYATCQQCHGAAGEGKQLLNAPRLAGTSDWYLVTELQEYKQGIRGSNPLNGPAVLMRGMSNMLANDQAIRDVVAHIVTLKPATQSGN